MLNISKRAGSACLCYWWSLVIYDFSASASGALVPIPLQVFESLAPRNCTQSANSAKIWANPKHFFHHSLARERVCEGFDCEPSQKTSFWRACSFHPGPPRVHTWVIEHIKTDMADRRSPRIYRTTCNGPTLSSAPKLMQSRSKKFKTSLHLRRTEDPCQFEHRQPLMGMYVYVCVCGWVSAWVLLATAPYLHVFIPLILPNRPSPPPPSTKKMTMQLRHLIRSSSRLQPRLNLYWS